ncbi:luciferase family oxidoreductase, group 1 [Paenibacillus sp. yr247]|uniref:LLM class flavin-dependent oxidoreductase n=1 Tax=Paenibacillus sp. yr247 TaxID=1761880 RepID=UPI000888F000|nr:LLM class flavin-dependent oxidoreductase [Paenibacillus sp. yr247]SDO11482.1 luciferase family oxidoreductase, group 1 [Paenibacillus sp. yr247]
MKLSVLDLIPVIAPADPAFALEQSVKLAQHAEKWGYTRYWVAEHHDMPGLACTSPEVLLAHIGARTQRIRIGSGALLLPHYKPLKVAEIFHTLATLYPGRIDLGIGRAPGGSAHVTIALSGNFLENVRELPNSLKALMALLDDRFECEGEGVSARPLPSIPPDVWMLGTNRKSADFAAEFGTGYVFGQFMSDSDPVEMITAYLEAFQPSRLAPKPRVIAAMGVICADTEEEAQALASKGAPWLRPPRDSASVSSQLEENPPLSKHKFFIGTAESVSLQLGGLAIDCGVDEFLIVTPIPDYEKRLRSYELLSSVIKREI